MDLIYRTVPYQQEQILVYFLRKSVQVNTVLDGRQSPWQGGERGPPWFSSLGGSPLSCSCPTPGHTDLSPRESHLAPTPSSRM